MSLSQIIWIIVIAIILFFLLKVGVAILIVVIIVAAIYFLFSRLTAPANTYRYETYLPINNYIAPWNYNQQYTHDKIDKINYPGEYWYVPVQKYYDITVNGYNENKEPNSRETLTVMS